MPNVKADITSQQPADKLYDRLLCAMEYDLGPSKILKNIAFFGDADAWGLDVVRDEGSGYRQARRRLQHINANPDDNFLISIPRSARVRLVQSGTHAQYEPGKFSLLSTNRPFFAHIAADNLNAPITQIIARISGPVLRQRIPSVDDYCGEALEIHPGAASYMVSLLDLALNEGIYLSDSQALGLCGNLIDAVTEAIVSAPELARHKQYPARNSRLRRLEQAQRFIIANISHPELNARMVADFLNISPRYLREIFSGSAHTVSAFIRETRLFQCHRDLTDPRLRHKPITEIAMTWGFSDISYFSRSYSARFGISPRTARRNSVANAGQNKQQ